MSVNQPLYNLSAFVLAAYKGVFVGQNVSICSTPRHQSKTLLTTLDWAIYTSLAVTIDLNSVGTTNQLDKIVGAWIDNSNSASPCLLYVPDSGQTIVCPPETTLFSPIFSLANIVNVYNIEGESTDGAVSIIFMNFLIDNFQSQPTNQTAVLALATDTPQGQPNFKNIVVGDQVSQAFINLAIVGSTPFLSVQSKGDFYITNMQVAIQGAYNTGGTQSGALAIVDNTIGQTVRYFQYTIGTDLTTVPFTILFSQDDLYFELDATHIYSFSNNLANSAGLGLIDVGYAYSSLI